MSTAQGKDFPDFSRQSSWLILLVPFLPCILFYYCICNGDLFKQLSPLLDCWWNHVLLVFFFCIMGIIYTVSYSFPLTQCKCSWFCRTILFPKCERILNVAHKYLLHVICKELQGLAAKANKVSNLGISVAVA